MWLDVPANGCLYLKAPQPSAEEKERMMRGAEKPPQVEEEKEEKLVKQAEDLNAVVVHATGS